MERSWHETIQLLGLDIEVIGVLVLVVLEMARQAIVRWRARADARAAVDLAGRRPVELAPVPWLPRRWTLNS